MTYYYTPTGVGAVQREVGEKLQELVSVLDYVPVAEHAAILQGTSNYDASDAFQNAAATGRGVFVPGRRYVITRPIDLNECPVLVGEGSSEVPGVATMIVAAGGTPFTTMFQVRRTQTQIRNLFLQCSRLAASAIRVDGGNNSLFDHVTIENSTHDGIFFSPPGNNISSLVSSCLIRGNGRIHGGPDAGTATNAAGGTTVTMSGAPDLTTLGIRPDLDLVKVGASPAATISSVTATTLTTTHVIANANTNALYEILIGHGVAIPGHGDNSAIVVQKSILQDCRASGLRDNGLYGALARDNVYEFNGYGRIIGLLRGANVGAREEGGYFEGNKAGAQILLESCIDATIRPAVGEIGDIYIPDINHTRGTIIEAGGIRAEGRTHLFLNFPEANIEFGNTYHIQHSAAAPDATLILPAVNSAPMRKYVLGNMETKIVLVFMHIGGRTFTIKAAPEENESETPRPNVNGVPGSTGISHTGSYTKLEIRLDSHFGWVVTG